MIRFVLEEHHTHGLQMAGPAPIRRGPARSLFPPQASAQAHFVLRQEEVLALRKRKFTGRHIAAQTGLSPATVSRILRRSRLSRWRDLVPAAPVIRYERSHPGELLHLDIKKLVRIVRPSHRVTGNRRDTVKGHGWEYVFVAIDDHSRLAHAAILPNEQQASAIAFLKQAVAYYERFGVRPQRVMTDNGPCFHSLAFGRACRQLGIKHVRTRPYTPKTNGKAERFIQPPYVSGPRPLLTTPPLSAQTNSLAGSIATTGTALTPLSA